MWILGLGILVTHFGLLGRFALAEPDEPRYAEIAREMLELRDWVTPHLNYVKYFEKPPLMYWLTAVNFMLFGMSEFVVRLWPALFALLGICMTYLLARSMYGVWTGAAAAAVLATTPLYFGLGQILILDMPLSAFMAVALGAFWFAWTEPAQRRACVVLLYGASGLAVLTKGPVAVVLIGGVILSFLVLEGQLAALRWLLSPLGSVVFAALTLPWFILVSHRNPEFVDFFIVKQHFDRFVRPDEHRAPWWFFVPIVFGGMLPWTAFVALAPGIVVRFLRRVATRKASAGALFCLIWSGAVFVFFSASGSKLATYVLPMFCPLAILVARFLHDVIAGAGGHLLRRGYVAVLTFAAGVVLAGMIANIVVDDPLMEVIAPRVYAGGAALMIGAGAALVLIRRGAPQPSFAVLLFAMLAVEAIAMSGREAAAEFRPLGRFVLRHATPDDQVVQYRHYVQGITFYGRRRTIMIGGRGELDFGSRQGRQAAFFWNTDAQLLDAWHSSRRLFLVINRVELEPLRGQMNPPPREVAAFGKKVIVVNFAERLGAGTANLVRNVSMVDRRRGSVAP